MQELRVVMGGLKDDIWISDGPLRNGGSTSIGVTLWGLGETLTRVSAAGEVVPWLAEGIRNIDPLTWQVRLRQNATFWDGAPVSPHAVATSFAQSCELQKDVSLLLDPGIRTRIVDARTLEFQTPEPAGNFAAALAHPQLIIHAANGALLTGPYRPLEFEADRRLVLEAVAGHWAGPPAIPRISVRVVPDFQARLQAFESGEADLIYAYPPEATAELERLAGKHDVASFPSMRAHSMQLNCMQPPLDDRAVREATSLAIDRDVLIREVLHGRGAPMTTLVPPWSTEYTPTTSMADVARAERLLDAAGWTRGPDGVRRKADQRLAFTLYTPTGPVLAMTALATHIASQLASLGYEVTPREVPSLSGAVKDGAYTAALRTSYSQLTGDPEFWLRLWLAHGGRANPGPSYANPDLDQLLGDYRRETDSARRRAYRHQLYALLAADLPHIFLLFVPLILVGRHGLLRSLIPDPNNEYFVGSALPVLSGGQELHA
jgi:peptide/nickel transport system substrate-binding protein